jgi:hypothetical protein
MHAASAPDAKVAMDQYIQGLKSRSAQVRRLGMPGTWGLQGCRSGVPMPLHWPALCRAE